MLFVQDATASMYVLHLWLFLNSYRDDDIANVRILIPSILNNMLAYKDVWCL